MANPHWLFGDQLGPHFLASGDGGPDEDAPVVMIEARSVFRRRTFHCAKAHLILSAMRRRAAELGDRVRYVHIPRLMILGSHALQQGRHPAAVTDWFPRLFVDGYDRVMVPNLVGMSQYAAERVGARACPFTGGYWAFLHRHRDRPADLDEVLDRWGSAER